MCTYDGERFLREQLGSIARQTLVPSELIVCDDASSDGTIAILDDFAATAGFPVHVVRNPTRLGAFKNFERAAGLCGGAYIALADQDDVWVPEKLQRLRDALARDPRAGYAFSNADLIDADGRAVGGRALLDRRYPIGRIERAFGRHRGLALMLKRDFIYGTTLMIRGDLRDLISPMPDRWSHDTWACTVAECYGRYGIAVPDSLVLYRRHAAQHSPDLAASSPDAQLSAHIALRHHIDRIARTATGRPSPSSIAMLDSKIAHLRAVAAMSGASPKERARLVAVEALSGRWFRYSPRLFWIITKRPLSVGGVLSRIRRR